MQDVYVVGRGLGHLQLLIE